MLAPRQHVEQERDVAQHISNGSIGSNGLSAIKSHCSV